MDSDEKLASIFFSASIMIDFVLVGSSLFSRKTFISLTIGVISAGSLACTVFAIIIPVLCIKEFSS